MKIHRLFFLTSILLFINGATLASQFTLTSQAFSSGGKIPQNFTCDGQNISPPMAWTKGPDATKSYALIMTDYDAIYSLRKYMQHWSIYNIPATTLTLAVASPGLTTGLNSYNLTGYRGPCPPRGTTHRYSFQLYALDVKHLALTNTSPTVSELMQAMDGHLLDQTLLLGKYTRPSDSPTTIPTS